MTIKQSHLLLALALITYAVSLRLLPHPANFAPMTAVAIFGGSFYSTRFALITTLAAATLSDALVGFYTFGVMATVWLTYAAITLISQRWLRKPTLLRGAVVTFAGSSLFFLTTNFAVWLFGNYYQHSWAGLSSCFALAIPFFRSSLLGDFCYTAILFGLTALVRTFIHASVTQPKLRSN